MRSLEETRLTRDSPHSGRPRVSTPNKDREIRLTLIQYRFGSVLQTSGTIHGWHNPRIRATTVLRRLRENNIRLQRAFVGPVRDNRKQRLRLQWAKNHEGASAADILIY